MNHRGFCWSTVEKVIPAFFYSASFVTQSAKSASGKLIHGVVCATGFERRITGEILLVIIADVRT